MKKSKITFNIFRKKEYKRKLYLLLILEMVILTFLSSLFLVWGTCSESDSKSPLVDEIEGLYQGKKSQTPIEKKISSQLLYEIKKGRQGHEDYTFSKFRTGIELDENGKTEVDIKANITPELLEEIKAKRGEVIHSSEHYNSIRTRIPLEEIEALAAHPDVIFIRPAVKAMLNK